MGTLDGQTALVTGASRGIGRGIARRLAHDGALVAVHYSASADAARETVDSIENAGGRAFPVHADFGDLAGVGVLFETVRAELRNRTGAEPLNILVNNAAQTATGPSFDDITPDLLDHYWQLNAKAPLFVTQRALAIMPDGGRVINISSGLTHKSMPEHTSYAMAKAALEQLTFQLASHVADRGITVNTVTPGLTDNGSPAYSNHEAVARMAKVSVFNRVGQSDDVAAVVAFLASPESRWVTGARIDATGGSLLR